MCDRCECKANPFQHASLWYWTDEKTYAHGPYDTQLEALFALLRHIRVPWYMRMWFLLKGLWHDTRG